MASGAADRARAAAWDAITPPVMNTNAPDSPATARVSSRTG